MDKPVIMCDIVALGELMMPEFEKAGFDYYKDSYLGEDGKLHLREDAPDWAKKEFEEYYARLHPVPDENGMITQY